MVSYSIRRPVGVLLTTLCILITASSGAQTQDGASRPAPAAEPDFYDILATETVRTLLADDHLRKTYFSVVGAFADTSRTLTDEYGLDELSIVTDTLDVHLRDMKAQELVAVQAHLKRRNTNVKSTKTTRQNRPRGLSDLLTGTIGKLAGGAASGTATGTAASPSPSKSGGIGGLISKMASGLFGKALDVSGPALAGAGFFGGIGAGEGAVQGMDLASAPMSMNVGAKVAKANNMEKAGLNGVIENAVMGLTASTLRGLREGGTMQLGNLNVGGMATSLGAGVGNGAAMGLKLTQKNLAPPPGGAGLEAIAGNLGFGVSNSLTSSIDVKALGMGAAMSNLGATAAGIGSGLGNGAVAGLRLSGKDAVPPPVASLSDISGLTGSLTFGLTRSVADSADINSLVQKVTGGSGLDVKKFIGPAASGLGKGLGDGAAIGLGLQPEQPLTPPANPTAPDGSGFDVAGITQNFASGLASRFLANGTVTRALSSLNAGGQQGGGGGLGGLSLGNTNFGKVANGFARGLFTGASDGIGAVGGVSALINGTSKRPAGPVADTNLNFDDSVGGAATGFGQGLGSSAVVAAQKFLTKSSEPSGQSNNPPKLQNRGLATSQPDQESSLVLRARQAVNNTGLDLNSLNVTNLVNADGISSIIQKGIEVLSCDGVGGLVLVLLGLKNSGSLGNGSLDPSTASLIQSILPTGDLHLQNGRNTYDINAKTVSKALNSSGSITEAADGVSVNGNKIIPFAVFLVVHIFIAISMFAVLFPLALSIEGISNMLARVDMPQALPGWTATVAKLIWILGFPPSLILILVFGILPASKTGHFQTPHGILGLLTLILSMVALGLFFVTRRNPLSRVENRTLVLASHGANQVLLVLSIATLVTGFTDLKTIVFCMTSIVSIDSAVFLGFSLGTMLTLGQAISGTDALLYFRSSKGPANQRDLKRDIKIVPTPNEKLGSA